jgi:ribonuclease PH
MRHDGRHPDQLRPVEIERGYLRHPAGSALIRWGNTHVICAASIDESVPRWLRGKKQGWLTAEYSLLPSSTNTRTEREVSRGRVSGRTSEIQRLIGRSLRAVVDLEALGERTLLVDCDVINADGGTRTAAITGAFVAVRQAIDTLLARGLLLRSPLKGALAAVSVGVVGGVPVVDLDYQEDFAASVDMCVVMTDSGRFIEVQGTAEGPPFSRSELDALLALADGGIRELLAVQQRASTAGDVDR